MAVFTPITVDGEAVYGAPHRDGDQWENSGHDLMYVRSARSEVVLVTITAVGPCSLGGLHHYVRTVAANALRQLGPFDRYQFNAQGIGVGFASFRITAEDGSPLPDDDSFGHPADLGVLFIRL